MNRNLVIATSVVVFHIAALWALQNGLLRRAVEIVVPVALLSEFVDTAPPQAEAPPPPQPTPRPPQVRPATPTPPPVVAAPAPTPTPVNEAPASEAPPQPAAPVAAAVAAPAAPARIELPSSDAAYLNNPKPPYPSMSKRLGEQGKVIVRVLIGVDGTAQQAEIKTSSGYERLDQAALATVLRWRYLPGKRGGVPEAMWFNVPINFVLE